MIIGLIVKTNLIGSNKWRGRLIIFRLNSNLNNFRLKFVELWDLVGLWWDLVGLGGTWWDLVGPGGTWGLWWDLVGLGGTWWDLVGLGDYGGTWWDFGGTC